ncbi:FAD-binding oxidoreductase [Erwiniaceae bacterium BAC15a-03b]|uniref:FAD-binding oxidoreductase n=1 Tax=Winslowiella arboricola TaxID=2978220 RepID=A0A9J6PQX8_9GAMM|nr:FAD-binding oxidoreductase [Winslowiella arboricola]MCU5774521.1 FAD-binding oxidoreductase [Winslowiella arboricola]MCU5778069.1 FAD-binding oxidoreductase [Winslowiella arboricola]
MPGPRVVPVYGDNDLPASVDVVVIGGGIIGVSTALELAEQGIRVALCEKGQIGHEQSSRNWGWVRISRRDPREVALMAEALSIWQNLDRRIEADTGYTRAGIVFACHDEQQLQQNQQWLEQVRDYPVSSQMLDAGQFRQKFPAASLPVKGALYTPEDGRAEPQKVAPAIAEAARRKGAFILTECAVRGIETQAGRVSSVITERGEIACQSVVLAGGAWSSLFTARHGIRLPQLKVMNTVIRTAPISAGPEEALWCHDFAIRKRQDGGYTVANGHANIADIVPDSFRYATHFFPALRSEWRALRLRLGGRFFDEARLSRNWRMDQASPFEYCRVLDPLPSYSMADGALNKLQHYFPLFRQARIAQYWAGCIDVVPDAVPVISAVDSQPGFFIATGFSGHGFGIGPAAGRLMADLVLGRTPVVDPHAFRFSRFSDGSKIDILSGV